MRKKDEIEDLLIELKTDLDTYPYTEEEREVIKEKMALLNWVLGGTMTYPYLD